MNSAKAGVKRLELFGAFIVEVGCLVVLIGKISKDLEKGRDTSSGL